MDDRFFREKKELAYRAHIFDVYNDYLTLPDGNHVVYDLIDHVAGCGILPVEADGSLVLVRQYRNAVSDLTFEIPAGCIDDNETTETCARRELEEETGFKTRRLTFVTDTYLAIGTSNERTAIYIAEELYAGEKRPDAEEFLGLVRVTLPEALAMIQDGSIIDSKTIIAIFAYALQKHV